MRAGLLRHSVTFQSPPAGGDSLGQPTGSWTDFAANVRAQVKPVAGRERLAANSVHAEVTHSVMLRYLGGLTAAHRMIYDGRTFEIQAVIDIGEMGRDMQLLCIEYLA